MNDIIDITEATEIFSESKRYYRNEMKIHINKCIKEAAKNGCTVVKIPIDHT